MTRFRVKRVTWMTRTQMTQSMSTPVLITQIKITVERKKKVTSDRERKKKRKKKLLCRFLKTSCSKCI